MRLFVRVGRMLGPAMGRLGTIAAKGAKTEVDGEALSGLLMDAFVNLDSGPLEETMEELIATVEEDGTPLAQQWTVKFSGKLFDLCKVLGFAIQSHFGDFLSGFGGQTSFTGQAPTPPKPSMPNEVPMKRKT
jgi:hypothetical protein